VEALIGAVHLDAGFDAALALVRRWFGELITRSDVEQWGKDPKTELQERLQARRMPVPAYRIRATRGQAHAQTFEVECEIPALGLTAVAEGRSKRAAEQEAARRMLSLMPQTVPSPPSKDHS
jgi:ribonuclease-3